MTPEQSQILLEDTGEIIGLLNDLVSNGNNILGSIQFHFGVISGLMIGLLFWMLAKEAHK